MELNRIEIFLLHELFKSRSTLSSYTLFKRSKLSFPIFNKHINNLQIKNYINTSDPLTISLTDSGRKLSLTSLKQKNEQTWKSIPLKFLREPVNEQSLYIPKASLMRIHIDKPKKL